MLILPKIGLMLVALRKESVDRNLWWGVRKAVGSLVALRKESVDRNQGVHYDNYNLHWSLSARRAWIEIFGGASARPLVAWSLSARRAWIEMTYVARLPRAQVCRSPQGERG